MKKRYPKHLTWRDPRIARLQLLLDDTNREIVEMKFANTYVAAEQRDRAAVQLEKSVEGRWREFTGSDG